MSDTTFIPRLTNIVSTFLNDVNRGVYGFASVAAMRAGPSPQPAAATNSQSALPAGTLLATTRGYYTPGDGGTGEYYFDPTDTTSSDNGGTVIVNSSGGRWKLLYNESLSAKQFGAKGDGVTDDTIRLQAAINVCQTLGVPLYLGGALLTYDVSSSLWCDISKLAMYGDGCGIRATTTAPCLILASSNSEGVERIQSVGFWGFTLAGPSLAGSVATQWGIMGDSHGLFSAAIVADVTLYRVGVVSFDVGADYITQCFDIKWSLCEFDACALWGGAVIRIQPGGLNYGENIVYSITGFHNCGLVLLQNYVSSQFNFTTPTFDYCDQYLKVLAGWSRVQGGYAEQSNDAAPQFETAADSLIDIQGLWMTQAGSRSNFPLMLSNGDNTSGFNKPQLSRAGIHWHMGVLNFNSVTNRPYLCEGTGQNSFGGISYAGYALSQASIPPNNISKFTSVVANGTFLSSIAGWNVTGAVTWDSTGGNGGGGSLKMVYSADPTSTYTDFALEGGDSAVITFDLAITGFGITNFVNVFVQGFDISGNSLFSSNVGVIGADVFSGTHAYATTQTRYFNAPAGTVRGRLLYSCAGGGVGSGLVVHIDNVVCCVATQD